MVGHAAEHHALAVLEGAEPRGLAVVPFAGAEGGVAVLAEKFAHEFLASERLGVHGEPRFSGVEHGAARDADGTAVAAEDVVVAEADAGPREAIDDGSLDVCVAVGGDGVGALVVGEEEEDVGLRRAHRRWSALLCRGSGGCRRRGRDGSERGGVERKRGDGEAKDGVEEGFHGKRKTLKQDFSQARVGSNASIAAGCACRSTHGGRSRVKTKWGAVCGADDRARHKCSAARRRGWSLCADSRLFAAHGEPEDDGGERV